jgi:hypothetical protein
MDIVLPILAPTLTKDIILTCVSSISSTIVSSHNIFSYITSYSHSSSDFQMYQDKLITTDLANKLLVSSSLINDIIKKYSNNTLEDNKESYKLIESSDYNIVWTNQDEILSKMPIPIRTSLQTTLEIINKINETLGVIQNKIKSHYNSYSKFIYNLNISSEVNKIIVYNEIFEKRLHLLFEVLKLYKDVV